MKKVGIIKRKLAICLIFLMCINSFAAIVSDNDGSAFITKAEFDSLKNNFQSQIDSYNQSIDSKIDGAIASYLSGIKLSVTEERQTYFNDRSWLRFINSKSPEVWRCGFPELKISFNYRMVKPVDPPVGQYAIYSRFKSVPIDYEEPLIFDPFQVGPDEFAVFKGRLLTRHSTTLPMMGWYYGGGTITTSSFHVAIYNIKQNKYDTTSSGAAYTLNWYPNDVSNSTNTADVSFNDITYTRTELSEPDEYVFPFNFTGGYTFFLASKCFGSSSETVQPSSGTTTGYRPSVSAADWLATPSGVTKVDVVKTAGEYLRSGTATEGWDLGVSAHTLASSKKQSALCAGKSSRITSWNQIVLTSTNNLLEFTPANQVPVDHIIEKNSKRYVRVRDGYPIVNLKAGEALQFHVEFENKTIDYRVYITDGPPSTPTTWENATNKVTDPTLTTPSWAGANLIKNGEGTINLGPFDHDTILFLNAAPFDATSTIVTKMKNIGTVTVIKPQ